MASSSSSRAASTAATSRAASTPTRALPVSTSAQTFAAGYRLAQPSTNASVDFASLLSGANAQGANGNQLQGMLSAAMGHIQSNVSPNSSVDEKSAEQAHNQAYNQGNAGGLDAQSMGAAAAIQAFKSFASGNAGGQEQGQQSMISKLIGMALAEASKLFNKAGGAQGGSEQDVLNSAGSTVMKLLVQNQVQGALSGQCGSAGAAQLMGLASKFLAK